MGNPVLAHSRTASERPAGVTIDLARLLAGRLGLPLQLLEFDTPGASGAALSSGAADIGFLAVDPVRVQTLRFTSPYVRIEGAYLVRESSPLVINEDVDRPGIRVVVGTASAYALFPERHLSQAKLVEVPKSEQVVDAFAADSTLNVAAGVRQQLQADAIRVPGMRLLPDAFMTIKQEMVLPRDRSESAARFIETFITEQRHSGMVANALERHGIERAMVADA